MSVSELQKRFDNKTLTGNTSFLLISFIFCVFLFFLFFLTGSPQNRTYMVGNVPFDLDL